MYLRTLIVIIITAFLYSCSSSTSSDSEGGNNNEPSTTNPELEVTDIQPSSGPTGTMVTISGHGFSSEASNNEVTFDGTVAEITSASESELEAIVPEDASTGTVSVKVDGETADGPEFTVQVKTPGISRIEPDSGVVGTQITISGTNFGPSPSENTVTFNGVTATISSASETELVTKVPQGASDGPIEVTVDEESATVPGFDVITYGAIEVSITTNGDSKDQNGYSLEVDGKSSDTDPVDSFVFNYLEQGTHEVALSGIAANCSLDKENPQSIAITPGDTVAVAMDVQCLKTLAGQILYLEQDYDTGEIFSTDLEGNNRELILAEKGIVAFDVSPDGTRIAYSKGTNIAYADLYVINADGTGKLRLTSSGRANIDPDWSPDGSKIAFSGHDSNGDPQIYTINPDGTGLTNLTNNDASCREPDWSPDGSKIVFDSYPSSGNDYEIGSMNADGSDFKMLTDNEFRDQDPVWSSDGTQILYVSDRLLQTINISLMDADGANQRTILYSQDTHRGPIWGPDQENILYSENDGTNYEIRRFQFNIEANFNLTESSNDERNPVWLPPLEQK